MRIQEQVFFWGGSERNGEKFFPVGGWGSGRGVQAAENCSIGPWEPHKSIEKENMKHRQPYL